MKKDTRKVQLVLYVISTIAFYIGAIIFFVDNNVAAGAMGTVAGTLFFAAAILNIKRESKTK